MSTGETLIIEVLQLTNIRPLNVCTPTMAYHSTQQPLLPGIGSTCHGVDTGEVRSSSTIIAGTAATLPCVEMESVLDPTGTAQKQKLKMMSFALMLTISPLDFSKREKV